jgi:hypothetical protein
MGCVETKTLAPPDRRNSQTVANDNCLVRPPSSRSTFSEEVVEAAVLLNDDHDVLNQVGAGQFAMVAKL